MTVSAPSKSMLHRLTPEGIALDKTVSEFASSILAIDPIEGAKLLSVNRNVVISRAAQAVLSKEITSDDRVRLAAMDFLASDPWIVGSSTFIANEHLYLWEPNRHHNVKHLERYKELFKSDENVEREIQGFALYHQGKIEFINRADAFVLAKINGQLHRLINGDEDTNTLYDGYELYSEDLW